MGNVGANIVVWLSVGSVNEHLRESSGTQLNLKERAALKSCLKNRKQWHDPVRGCGHREASGSVVARLFTERHRRETQGLCHYPPLLPLIAPPPPPTPLYTFGLLSFQMSKILLIGFHLHTDTMAGLRTSSTMSNLCFSGLPPH